LKHQGLRKNHVLPLFLNPFINIKPAQYGTPAT